MQMQFREYRKQDYRDLVEIIRKTWHYDEFCSPKTANKLANVFLSSCLTNYTYSRVVLADGKAAGIILVNNIAKHTCSAMARLRQLKALATLYCCKEGRQAARIFGSVHGIDQHLLEKNHKHYPAELALFALSDAYRGKGIGKQLFQAALDYMKQEGLDSFYLFTDTSCNYGFYEHQGMKRCCEHEHSFHMQGKEAAMRFFIYEYQLEKQTFT